MYYEQMFYMPYLYTLLPPKWITVIKLNGQHIEFCSLIQNRLKNNNKFYTNFMDTGDKVMTLSNKEI